MLRNIRPWQIAGPENAMLDEIAEGKIVHAVPGTDPTDRTLACDPSERVERAFDQGSFAGRIEIRKSSVVDPPVTDDFVAAGMKLFQRIGEIFGDAPVGVDRALDSVSGEDIH